HRAAAEVERPLEATGQDQVATAVDGHTRGVIRELQADRETFRTRGADGGSADHERLVGLTGDGLVTGIVAGLEGAAEEGGGDDEGKEGSAKLDHGILSICPVCAGPAQWTDARRPLQIPHPRCARWLTRRLTGGARRNKEPK